MTGKHVFFFGLTIATGSLATYRTIVPRAEAPALSGTWLTTVVLKGERPLEIAITFSPADAGPVLRCGHGRWSRAGACRFSIAFTIPCEINGTPERRVTGTLLLDELGRLRGPVIAERVDPGGRAVDSIPGVAKAKRILATPAPISRTPCTF
jgi:hypothetical protein